MPKDTSKGTDNTRDAGKSSTGGQEGSWHVGKNGTKLGHGPTFEEQMVAFECMARGIRSVGREVDIQLLKLQLNHHAKEMRDTAKQLDDLGDSLQRPGQQKQADLSTGEPTHGDAKESSSLETSIKEKIKDLTEKITEIKTRLSKKRETFDGERSELKDHLDKVREGVPYDEIESSRESFINERKQLVKARQESVASLIEEHPCTKLEMTGLDKISYWTILRKEIKTKQEYDNGKQEYEALKGQTERNEQIGMLCLELAIKMVASNIEQSRENFNKGIKGLTASFYSQAIKEGLLVGSCHYDIEIAKKYRRICILDQQLGDHPQDLQDADIAIFDDDSETQKDLKLLNKIRKKLEKLNGTRPYSGSSSDTEMQDDEHKAEAESFDPKGKGRASANKETPPPEEQAKAQREDDKLIADLDDEDKAELDERGRQAALQLQRQFDDERNRAFQETEPRGYGGSTQAATSRVADASGHEGELSNEQLARQQGLETRNDEQMALDVAFENLTGSEIAESDLQEVQNLNQQGHEDLNTIDDKIDILDHDKLTAAQNKLEALNEKLFPDYIIEIKSFFSFIIEYRSGLGRSPNKRETVLHAYNSLKDYYSELNDNDKENEIKDLYKQAGFDYAQDEQQS